MIPPAGATFLILLILLGGGCAKENHARLTIIHTNDLHGHILPERVREWKEGTGGYAAFAAWVAGVREENLRQNVPTLLLDAGDFFMGTPEGNLSQGAAVVELMNATGYDALTVGNHEFDYGYENLERLAGAASFPFLGANVHLRGSARLPEFLQPFLIKDYPGLTVAVIGLVTEETGVITLPHNVDELVFHDPASAVRFYLPLIEERGADLVVVLSHLGREEDRRLAREVPEIDVIIGGHSHNLIPRPRREAGGRALICQAGEYGRHAGRLDLRVNTQKGGIARHRWSFFQNRKGALPPDPETKRIIEKIKNEVGAELSLQVGTAEADLFPPEEGESPLGNLLADAIREAARTDVAFHNAYGIRAALFEGPITLRDLYLVMPFDNTIVTMELTGRQLRQVMEQSLSLEKGMLQVSGLRAEYSLQREAGERLLRLEIAGEEAREEALYSAAVNSFMAEGGDYFRTFTEGKATRDTGIAVREALAETVRRRSPLFITHPEPERLVPKR